MNRFLLSFAPARWGLSWMLVFVLEAASFARTPTLPASAHETHLDGPAPIQPNEKADSAATQPPPEWVASRMPICHISRHPRDGIRAELHACPLVVADRTENAPPALTVMAAADSVE
jgi:hypothetical protein